MSAASAEWNTRAAVGVRHAGAGAGRGGTCRRRAPEPARVAREQRAGGEFAACGDAVVSHESVDCDAALESGIGENWPGFTIQQEVLGRYPELIPIGDCGALGEL